MDLTTILFILSLPFVILTVYFGTKNDFYESENYKGDGLSLIHISEPTRQAEISYAVFCLKKKSFLILLFLFSLIFPNSVNADYWLIIGTYRQGPGGRPEVSGITSPSLHSIPMKDLDTCNLAGEQITNEIYKPVWQFDSKWTCVFSGDKK